MKIFRKIVRIFFRIFLYVLALFLMMGTGYAAWMAIKSSHPPVVINSSTSTVATKTPDLKDFPVVSTSDSSSEVLSTLQAVYDKGGGIISPITTLQLNGQEYKSTMVIGDVVGISDRMLYLVSGYQIIFTANPPYVTRIASLAIEVPVETKILYYASQKPIDVPQPQEVSFAEIKSGDFVAMTIHLRDGKPMEIVWFALNPARQF